MFGLTKRLEQVRQASNPREHCEEEHVKAGRDAEKSFIASLARVGFDETSFFCGLRVPDEYQTRRRELDIVLLDGTGIYCLEVKNWSGKIYCSDNNKLWLQTKRHKIGDEFYTGHDIEHENGLEATRNKAALLREYLSKNDVIVSESFFHTRVLFVNPNCKLDPKILEDRPQVLLPEDLDKFVDSFRKTFISKLSASLTPGWLSGQLSFSNLNLIRSALNKVGTWDIIHLNGGKRLYGDYRDCTYFSVNRSETEALEFTHQRNGIVGSVLAIAGQVPTSTVYFLQRGGSGWLWNSYSAVVKIPFNTEVNFRVCGDEIDAKIQANDITRIEISI